jgi:predicted small secreted protein
MLKKMTILAVVAATALTGCATAGAPGGNGSDSFYVEEVALPDGGTVQCVVYNGYQKGGISCDWSGR